ncbi:MAG: Shikimate dehydrogenase-like protein [Candidatus Celerinatantimonas neptuna]|nr:MAG: Shikimate dehydrogenase-like protein [Candidatus Celerinatantimonas neptuna]
MDFVNRDTIFCISLAGRPSNYGTRFHNYLYQKLGLNYLYKAFTTSDLKAAIGGIRALGIRGCGVSMPYKEDVIEFLDELDESAKAIQSVNTIVNSDGHLKAYNTDYIAIVELLRRYHIPNTSVFALRGSGGMAKAVACGLRDLGFHNGYIIAKNKRSGPALANHCGYHWVEQADEIKADLLINATPIGMTGDPSQDQLSFPEQMIENATTIFDVVAVPTKTPLLKIAKARKKMTISGAEVYAIQAVEQFVLYTNIRPDHALFEEAADYARQG